MLATGVVGGLAWVATGCTDDADPAADEPAQDPDAALAAEVVAALDGLLALHAAAVVRHPRLARRLQPARAAHEGHRAAVVEAAAAGEGVAVPPAGPSASPPVDDVPARGPATVRAVATAEADAAETLSRLAFSARSGPFARLIAGMAASSHQHALALLPAPETP